MKARRRTLIFLLWPPLAGLAVGAVLSLTFSAVDANTAPVTHRFRDVAVAHGIVTRQRGLPPCGLNAAGVAWGDVEGDGDLDLFLPRQLASNQLWVQGPSGDFEERGRAAGVDLGDLATSAAFADYDNDGDQDLFVGANGPDHLYKNLGNGTFSEVTFLSGTSDLGQASSAAWADYDGDGRLDLHVANGFNCAADPSPAPNRLYRNAGGDRFEDVSALLPARPASGVTLDALWLDFDRDGDQDLYLGNDNLNERGNALLANSGGRFHDVSQTAGADLSRFTMGVAAGDVDGDGNLDLVSTDIGREALLLSGGAGRFDERATEAGFGRERAGGAESITWGTVLADFDNDTDLDAYSAAGALGLGSKPQDDALYENLGEGGFRPLTVSAPRAGRTVAPADWDGDGDVDLAVAQLDGPLLLLENRGPRSAHWLELRLLGRVAPRDACGARVILRAAGRRQVRAVECRAGDRAVHFGLEGESRIESVRVEWPSGRRQVLRSLRADRLLRVVEPRARP
ncbi:MAG: CRTAC1 family protein [Solirubrobacterales bacterium]